MMMFETSKHVPKIKKNKMYNKRLIYQKLQDKKFTTLR